MKILIWGTGNTAKAVLENGIYGEIVGFIKSSPPTEATFCGKPIFTPGHIGTEYDVIYVASIYSAEIYETIQAYHMPEDKICFSRLPDALAAKYKENYQLAKRFLSEANLCEIDDYTHFGKQLMRDLWVKKQLEQCEAGKSLLDAGAGDQRYKKYCSHLRYVSQDLCQYDGTGNGEGLQTEEWDVSQINIISDIIDIPVPDESFDYILCTEVFEHIPNPELAMKELSRILKKGGRLILSAPFTSVTHFAPYHYYPGINKYWYEEMCLRYGMKILEMCANGNYFRHIQLELERAAYVYKRHTGDHIREFDLLQIKETNRIMDRLAERAESSSELMNLGWFVLIEKP